MERRPPQRRIQFFLRDFRLVEATVAVPAGITLAVWLNRKRGQVAVLDARWTPTGERVPFAVLRLAQVLWASAPDGDVAHGMSSGAVLRPVEFLLEGGLFVQGELPLSDGQRIGDYLDTVGPFLPLTDAVLMRSGRPPRDTNVAWRDIALNQDAVQAIWEARTGGDRHAPGSPPEAEPFDVHAGEADGVS